jgi:hypothetical protein
MACRSSSRVLRVESIHEADPGGIDLLLDAIAQVESHNDPGAKGDGGKASGIYQIHRAYWADGTKFLGVDWDYAQVADQAKAREVVRAYLRRYGAGSAPGDGPDSQRRPERPRQQSTGVCRQSPDLENMRGSGTGPTWADA